MELAWGNRREPWAIEEFVREVLAIPICERSGKSRISKITLDGAMR